MFGRIFPARVFVPAFAALLLVACSSSNEATATQSVAAVHAAIVRIGESLGAVGPDARQRYSDELTQLAKQNDALLSRIKAGDYAAVDKEAKALLAQVDALAPQVAADKVKRDQQLVVDWSRLETEIPAALAAAAQQPAAGQAQGRLPAFQELWNQAVAAQKSGNLLKAVELGLAIERGLGSTAPAGG